jgi:hypothetical protein
MIKTVLALVIVPVVAFANIGDTREQAVARYGKPDSVVGNLVHYHSKGWIIAEWYDANGLSGMISYAKANGKITKSENDAFCWVNLPAGMNVSDWLEMDAPNKWTREFRSFNQLWCFESGLVKIGKFWFDSICIGTKEGVDGFEAEIHGNSTTTTVTPNNNPLLPL